MNAEFSQLVKLSNIECFLYPMREFVRSIPSFPCINMNLRFFFIFFVLTCVFKNSCSTVPPTQKQLPAQAKKTPLNGTCLSGDCWQGKGTFEYFNKDRYIGEFREGLPHGEGLLIFANGSSISGEFQNGKVHGFASEFDERRRLIYSGEWVEGKKKNSL